MNPKLLGAGKAVYDIGQAIYKANQNMPVTRKAPKNSTPKSKTTKVNPKAVAKGKRPTRFKARMHVGRLWLELALIVQPKK